LLLAAGMGTRLRPITDHVPKCLVQIQGRPLLGYWLDLLLGSGIERVLINTHYLPDAVRSYVAGSPWRERVVIVHEEILLGTGGTVLRNRRFLEGGTFLLAHADNLTRFSVDAFATAHRERPPGVEITMMTFDTDTPTSCGIVELDRRGVVTAFHEKVAQPPGSRANAAVYMMEPSIIDFVAAQGSEVVDLSTEVIPHFMGRILAFHNHGFHRDIGTPESLSLAQLQFENEG
jgi:mannose-1-phosphate guanylyltransferase